MALEMKIRCQGCGEQLPPDAEAYVCSYECTYCNECMTATGAACPHCGGELLRRPKRNAGTSEVSASHSEPWTAPKWWLIWVASFAVWTFFGLLATLTAMQVFRQQDRPRPWSEVAGMEFTQMLPFAPLTPLVFVLVGRFPIRRQNWIQRSLLYLACGVAFSVAHVAIRSATPYGTWDPATRGWRSTIWDYKARRLNIAWPLLERDLTASAFDDITSTYLPILLLAYVVAYYSGLKERERRAALLEAQLSKAHLQALKSRLQPHFLFNTMHSISGLMFTDVVAADKMMTRLSELLRLSLEDDEQQITTLSRELEFLNGYLQIEKIRFGDRMTVLVDIPGEILDAQVPHLLLQPFVENAVQHGIGRLSSSGEIRISGQQDGARLCLTIEDNGPGFCLEDGVPADLGVGIRTSQERLRALFGPEQSLAFNVRTAGGAQVTICLPFRQMTVKE
jgi:two-component system, LytTR family, sensor kinase